MKTKLSPRFWCALTLFSLMGQVAWVVENMYFNVFIYNMFNAGPEEISAMVAASAVAATLTTVFIGALSDRIGKRKLFISGGYILWGISIFSFVFIRLDVINALFPMVTSVATLGISLVIIMDCVMTFFGSSANDAAFNAWITDSTDPTNRGAVEGINSMMPLVAILVVFGGFMFFDLSLSESWVYIFSIIGAVVLVIGILGLFLIDEPKLKPSETGYFYNIFYGFRPSSAKKSPLLYIGLIAFAIFNISIQVFMPYLIIYYEKTLALENYVFIMAPAIIIASVVTALWGKVYDKKGFKFSVLISVLWLISGYAILFFSASVPLVFIGSLLMMCGYLSSMAVFGALIRDFTPNGKSGMFQGLRIFSQVLIPGVIGPFIGAQILKDAELIVNSDGTTSFLPNRYIFLGAAAVIVLLLPFISVIGNRIKPKTVSLKTPFEDNIEEIPFPEYPRPLMERDSYLPLNGKWELIITKGKKTRYDGKILVPFPIESRLSGVETDISRRDKMTYSRSFSVDKGFISEKTVINFGAADQFCKVFLNGNFIGEHEGGYVPFSFDITESINIGENTLKVEVCDPLDKNLPYGKQSRKRGGMWYTPTSGIWGTVWIESMPRESISSVKITPSLTSVVIETEGGEDDKTVILGDKRIKFSGNRTEIEIDNPVNWTPENPHLYNFTLISGKDSVRSYFALRTIEVKGRDILLNGKPYFFHGLLDQGYYSDGIYLPATSEGYRFDIEEMKKLGFNMLRKHIKIEPQLFYHYCDKIGMIVFQDLVNNGKYNFFIDTALPTIGLKKGISHRASLKRRQCFEKSAKDTIELLYNHPSVCYYTLFNEGWGQHDAKKLYIKMKELEPTRVWDATSGWFQTGLSDVLSEHIYFKPIKLKNDSRPLVLSEFGGYSCKIEGHSMNLDNTYGYKFFNDTEKFSEALEKLYLDEIVPAIKKEHLCALVLTQVSDVEDETNGLLTYDRKVLKVSAERMLNISEKLKNAFYR